MSAPIQAWIAAAESFGARDWDEREVDGCRTYTAYIATDAMDGGVALTVNGDTIDAYAWAKGHPTAMLANTPDELRAALNERVEAVSE